MMDREEEASPKGETYFADVTICNRRGLHARASAAFVKCAEVFKAHVSVTCNGQTVDGTSIMSLLMLGASQGTTIVIGTRGREAISALEALVRLVEAGFHE